MAKAYEDTLARKLVRAAELKNYVVFREPGYVNIFYTEGMDMDGRSNGNKPNYFNDIRCVVTFEGSEPIMKGIWQATTEPGKRYTINPVAEGGAARIQFGQYHAWQVGMHRGDHEALIQTGGPVSVCRDLNKDYDRTGDRVDTGYFGINQHWGYDLPADDIGPSSAGCLVGRTKKGHKEFMALVKSDPRYIGNHQFVYYTAVFPAKDII